tara:strand:+ start:492 stop:677 length:186 start_codon:yes stop_codon:yes gene_type:complete
MQSLYLSDEKGGTSNERGQATGAFESRLNGRMNGESRCFFGKECDEFLRGEGPGRIHGNEV